MSVSNYYAYKLTRDYGFAPNPFFNYCTLACCKPRIRIRASVSDWIIGTGSVENDSLYNIIYVMKITEKLTFEEYWNDSRFKCKRPVLNGSLKQIHGDNIYNNQNGSWFQMNSHHSLRGGKLNQENLKKDLSGLYVLISNHFTYFGNRKVKVPEKYKSICPRRNKDRDYRNLKSDPLAIEFVDKLIFKYGLGIYGDPIDWEEYKQLNLFNYYI
ncbi:hypothetical protein [Leptospira santarosai]|uniref:Nucleotide modification associated domain-containing protein n=1 Tax=Leptospira santarosai str. ZUN179 TaxID=1049985 RepID=M6UV48_9LEPT|nr:hypothetical protein [Leptospira santarosai]EMO46636.1 hypothetical protein LEP1GSC187_2033 [Leptospira santarosai str. ZUN179]